MMKNIKRKKIICKKCEEEIEDGYLAIEIIERERQKVRDAVGNLNNKLILLEDYIDDLKDRVSEHVNISEHTGDMRKLILQCKEVFAELLDDDKE